ncbi:hypothetical protein KEM60_02433 [Austwickia sp. TVS 96-490-7B]|uniref:glycerophosphodiester phosphodiesterase n=1 Tax=Austwickia sp. TVS 96-490-7B TaxID=2830843 RepID=UPI001C59043A|nr:glycerophosphodiester phosphodiesterase family protein [Austwickia sp. TVS 96-490-7B]MBW3086222.1 hypothetical protein [Austwickia sp. TVS 96-490-7B]
MARRGPWDGLTCDIQAHAGAQGAYVGNSWPAFAEAARQGARNVELDVRVSADGVPVVWHDMVLEPGEVSCGDPRLFGKRIDEVTWRELSRVDVGQSMQSAQFPHQRGVAGQVMLSLVELFQRLSAVDPGMWFTVEIKLECDDPCQVARRRMIWDAIRDAISAGGVRERVIVHSFDWHILQLAAHDAPDLPRSALASHGETWLPGSPYVGESTYDSCGGDLALAAYWCGVDAIAPCHHDARGHAVVHRAFVERAHRLGLVVNPWTVDAPGQWIELLRAGVDGIVTNYPGRLKELLKR